MKKINYLFFIIACWLMTSSYIVSANPVAKNIAQTVAINFYSQNFQIVNPSLTLTYIEYANDGQALYYVFNVNTNDGFVIVSAEDAAHPILGCSNKGQYVVPRDNNNIAWWMNCRKQEIIYARTKSIAATSNISNEWAGYMNNTASKNYPKLATGTNLVKSTWDQPYPYNAMCPGGSLTGCVATTMAQIMRYWQYPPNGHGANVYWDEQKYGYQENQGYLSANFDTSKYDWSAMPLSINSANNEIAKLMYDAGVSVDMDYGSESGAEVITGDYPICSQTAFIQYFGYNAATIQGLYQANYDTANWRILIENEINNKRPVQYVGFDSTQQDAGHTWVCDGYEGGVTPFHMNWGWSGTDDGWFALNALDAGGYHFNWWNEALIGIEPPAASPYFVAKPTFGCKGMTVQFTDQSFTESNLPIISRTWLFPGGTPSTSTALNPSIQYNTAGTYDVSEIISDANGTDTLIRKAYISVDSAGAIPFEQDFQSAVFPPAGWSINNSNSYTNTWQLATFTGAFGGSSQSMYFDNCQGKGASYSTGTPPLLTITAIIGERQQIYTPEYNYTGITNPKLYFDVAYAPYSSVYSDTLVIYYSTDCGATFHQVYSKGGLTLGTTHGYVSAKADTNNLGCFVPLSYQWRVDTISIPAIAGVNSVMFSFENRSGNGSPIYIDNINIPGVVVNTSVANISSNPSVRVWPNPNNGQFTIGLENISDGSNPFVRIYNVLGQEVYTSQLKNNDTQINLNVQPKGVYIYRIFTETGLAISTGRIVVE